MNLQKAIIFINSGQMSAGKSSLISKLDPACVLILTSIYLVFILSIPLTKPDHLIWYAIFPILMAPLTDITYSSVFRKSLFVLPFIILIGIFNPILDKDVVFEIGNFEITAGWITFLSLIVRGLLAMQVLIILIHQAGFIEICNALNRLGMPKVLTIQLLMLYRYLRILMEEAVSIHYSVSSRGYGKKSFPIKFWSRMVGNLLFRTVERARHIHQAMISRGFDGNIPLGKKYKWTMGDTAFLGGWIVVFFLIYFCNFSKFLIA